jgi:hypothetical protein
MVGQVVVKVFRLGIVVEGVGPSSTAGTRPLEAAERGRVLLAFETANVCGAWY